jgi:NAD-dependent DNA ligase
VKTWYSDPASNRQLKVLQFFGFSIDEHITKGVASRIITDLFRHHDKRSVWEKYVYLTGDVGQESPNLLPFDPAQIESTIVPDDWQPPRPFSKQNGSERPIRASRHKGEHTRHIQMALDILKEGIPFDDPVPVIEYGGRRFCFTGKFSLGTRQWCEDTVASKGGIPVSNVITGTNYLVVGGEVSHAWANEAFGRKIEKALVLKLEDNPISLVTEEEWGKTI